MTDWRKLCQDAAEALSGKPVILRFQQPPSSGAKAECYRRPDGLLAIDIAPGASPHMRYVMTVHEAAHAKLHADIAPVSEPDEPGAIVLEHGGRDPVVEDEAHALTREWYENIERRAAEYDAPGQSEETRVINRLIVAKFRKGE